VSEQHFDVIIVGGRPAGASLAARLGEKNLRVLVVDRATFPSAPNVPSCPQIHPETLKLLEEVGIAESAIAAGSVKINTILFDMRNEFTAKMDFSKLFAGEPGRYSHYSFDREHLDMLLWHNLERFPSVTTKSGFAVSKVMKTENDKVIGIIGRDSEGVEQIYTADLIVGADGRFSTVARQVGAKTVLEAPEVTAAAYYATWSNATYVDAPHEALRVFSDAHGLNVIFFPRPNHELAVAFSIRPELVKTRDGESIEDFYTNTLKAHPQVWRHLKNATRRTPVFGLKQVVNGYREGSGSGWVLIGDAYHYKDPVDGQGIYDALLSAKLLSEAIINWKVGSLTWAYELLDYNIRIKNATLPQYRASVGRLKKELFQDMPPFVTKHLLRWLLNDAQYQKRFIQMLQRRIDPEKWLTPQLMIGAIVRGIQQDLRNPRKPAPKRQTGETAAVRL
jgi:flavin-dependent dehydrogenase